MHEIPVEREKKISKVSFPHLYLNSLFCSIAKKRILDSICAKHASVTVRRHNGGDNSARVGCLRHEGCVCLLVKFGWVVVGIGDGDNNSSSG